MEDKDIKITPEEKEMLRYLMEDDEACKHWDFFSDMNWEVSPPEFFMRGKPDPPEDDEASGE